MLLEKNPLLFFLKSTITLLEILETADVIKHGVTSPSLILDEFIAPAKLMTANFKLDLINHSGYYIKIGFFCQLSL